MSLSQPAAGSSKDLKDFIQNWKSKTRIDSQYDRIRRLVFSANEKPSSFKSSDFFPPIPDSILASDSEEQTLEHRKDTVINEERRSSLSKRKLDYEPNVQINDEEEDNEKQRRQVILNESNNLAPLKSHSPIDSPSRTTRNTLKIKRASILKELEHVEVDNNPPQNEPLETTKIDKIPPQEGQNEQEENNVENDEDIFKPPTPPPPPPPVKSKSSITISKVNAPLKEIEVDVTKAPSNQLRITRQLSSSKINQSLNDSDGELLQSNNFIKRQSLSNRTVNSTVNSSASVLFKPTKTIKQIIPPPPLFNQNPSDESSKDESDVEASKKSRKKKIKKLKVKKTPTTTKENKSKSLEKLEDKVELPQVVENDKQDEIVTQPIIDQEIIPEINVEAELSANLTKTNNKSKNKSKSADKSKITSFFTSVPTPQSSSKTKKKPKKKTDDNDEEYTEKEKKIKKVKTSTKRQPLKNLNQNSPIKNNNKKISKKVDEGYFANNKTVLLDRASQAQEQINTQDENLPLALRRSKRAKLDKNSQPVYAYETIDDYKGNKLVVRTVVGQKENINVKINKELCKMHNGNKKLEKNKKKNEPNWENKNNSSLDDFREPELFIQEPLVSQQKEPLVSQQQQLQDEQMEEPQQQQQPVEVQPLPTLSDQSLSVSGLDKTNCMDNSNVNKSQEVVYLNKDGSVDPEALHLYFFNKNLEKKQYEFCTTGVHICPLSDVTGVIRLDQSHSTRTNIHNETITYFVQRGVCIFSINNIISIHNEKDVITVPKRNHYKIKSCSTEPSEEHTYLFFRFDKSDS
ncbi:unnamed protein product [Brachionus calyciflorus]|uniref:Uncharacterized protein n=1 Tax=Brachionus calyciflorus TaxID=104777 RepID=A0A813V1B6_9BILA|nr:unnamed protein product [Brachionus calyciflorus]